MQDNDPSLKNTVLSLRQILTSPTLVVGGTVRDRLLGRSTDDLDLVTLGDPHRLSARIATRLKGRSFPLDTERGIFRVSVGNLHVDLSRAQGKDFEADLDRRDFTVNAMAVKLTDWCSPQWKQRIIDRHNGRQDLKKKHLRAVSKSIFTSDPLRLLRAFRLSAELGFSISPETTRLVKSNKQRVRRPAPERIREEILRMFASPQAHEALLGMDQAGLLEILWPEIRSLRKTGHAYYGKNGVLHHTLEGIRLFEDVLTKLVFWFPGCGKKINVYLDQQIAGHARRAHLKWSLLLHDIGKPGTARVIDGRLRFFEHEHLGARIVKKMAHRFRWSSDESTIHQKLVQHHMRPGNLATHSDVSDKALHRFFRDLGDDAVGMLLVSLADHLTYLTPRQLKKRATSHERLTIRMVRRYYQQRDRVLPQRLLNGNDVMKYLHLAPSPLIGRLLQDALEAQVEGRVKSASDALAYLKGRVAVHQKEGEVSSKNHEIPRDTFHS